MVYLHLWTILQMYIISFWMKYTSSKILKDIFDFDNQDFISQLSARGFHVIENGHSNYAMNLSFTYILSEYGICELSC